MIKEKLQLNSEKAEMILKEIENISKKYEISAYTNGSIIGFDLCNAITVEKICRCETDEVGDEDIE